MKRLVVVLGGLLMLPAFAEVAPFYYTDTGEYADWEYGEDGMWIDEAEIVSEETDVNQMPVIQPKAKPVVTTSLRGGTRVATSQTNSNTKRGADSNSRVVAARTTTSRTTESRTPVSSRAVVDRGTVSRVATNATSANTGATRRAVSNTRGSVARATTGNSYTKTATGKTEKDFEDDILYTGRLGVRSSAYATRVPTIRVGSAVVTTDVSSSEVKATTTAEMDELAELTDFCKAQYTACMDNFCNVLDDNQGRCSCSKNIKNYEKTEQALKAATEELQEVAQKIQYIGLSADEITTLFSETEAEEAMRGQTDTSQIKLNLDKVRDMIIDVQSGNAGTSSDGLLSFDLSNLLEFTISSTGFDLSALFGTGVSNTSSISNQRGETLYKTATARCKANVLNSCTAQGVDPSVITNAYDLEIDKQCLAYERNLTDSNDQMAATVRNAKVVLQKGRLLVSQQKNQYDMRGCVTALDECMQDDYVCGSDYEYCLDPSGKYIVNGAVLVGSLPGKPLNEAINDPGMFKNSLYKTWCVDSSCSGTYAWDYDGQTGGNLAKYINETLSSSGQKEVDLNMSKFLQYKIGYHDNKTGKNHGMCMSVLNKCQNYTYDKKGYMPNNSVISEYLYRTMIQIKATQDELLTEFAEQCVADVASCLSTNNYDTATNKNIPVNACKASIATCMSVNGNVTTEPTPQQMLAWAEGVYNGTIAPATDANTGTGD